MRKFRRKKQKTPLQVLVEGFFEVRSGTQTINRIKSH